MNDPAALGAAEPEPHALYAPLAAADWVVGHLGQSVDGRIATEYGHSHYVTGPANIDHLHHMLALADAVLVGPGTVAHDDPRLTVRRVEGRNPVRVVLDPKRRLEPGYHVFTDGAALTLWMTGPGDAPAAPPGRAEHVTLAALADGLDPRAVVAALRERGLRRLFVEGGGLTVSRFLDAGQLDRLQVCVAPMIIGSGRPAVTLPRITRLDHALRPPCRILPMGEDVLFDFDLRAEPPTAR